MRTGMIARKLGMTRVFDAAGSHVPVTVLEVDACQVVGQRTEDRDGYTAVQLGVVHGPVVRDHGHELTKKVRKLALKTALSAKAASGQLRILDTAQAETHKTKVLASALDKLGWSSALILEGEATDENFSRAVRNIPGVDLLPQEGANVYDILRRDTLVLTKDALTALEARLK